MTLPSIPKTTHHGETTFVTFKLKKTLTNTHTLCNLIRKAMMSVDYSFSQHLSNKNLKHVTVQCIWLATNKKNVHYSSFTQTWFRGKCINKRKCITYLIWSIKKKLRLQTVYSTLLEQNTFVYVMHFNTLWRNTWVRNKLVTVGQSLLLIDTIFQVV